MADGDRNSAGPPEGARSATGGGPAKKPQRFSAKMKTQIVMRLLRGEDIELLSREFSITAARISQWRDAFLMAGSGAMKERPSDPRDKEIADLREKLGQTTMEVELLYRKIDHMEAGQPLRRRRSRK
jgi:transposase-like protein